jgi:5'-nucleotidase
VLGSAAIDPTIVDPLVQSGVVVNDGDETGRATVQFTIPEGTPGGTLLLTVYVPETGTSIALPIQVVSNEEPIENTKLPKITGPGKVGGTLKASGGSWSVASPTLSFQWNRDGVPIEGATASTYTVVAADAGAEITVTVTASKDGYADGTATSDEKKIGKARSDTSNRLNKLLVSSNSTVTAKIEVDGQFGLEPVGTVNVYDGRKLIATATLAAGDDGRVTVTLPKLGRGIHLITVQYEGSGQLEGSTGFPDILFVW